MFTDCFGQCFKGCARCCCPTARIGPSSLLKKTSQPNGTVINITNSNDRNGEEDEDPPEPTTPRPPPTVVPAFNPTPRLVKAVPVVEAELVKVDEMIGAKPPITGDRGCWGSCLDFVSCRFCFVCFGVCGVKRPVTTTHTPSFGSIGTENGDEKEHLLSTSAGPKLFRIAQPITQSTRSHLPMLGLSTAGGQVYV